MKTLLPITNLSNNLDRAIANQGTLCLTLLALLGIVFSPYFCVKFSPTEYQTEYRQKLTVNTLEGKTVQISSSICGIPPIRNKSTNPHHEDQNLTKSCFYCLLNHTGGLLPPATGEDSFFVEFLKIVNFNNPFIITRHHSNSQSRAPPWKSSISV